MNCNILNVINYFSFIKVIVFQKMFDFTKFTEAVDFFLGHANTKNLMVIGDANVRWPKNEMSVCDWASRMDLK